MDHDTSTYAERSISFNQLLSKCNTHQLYIITLGEVSRQFHEDLYCVQALTNYRLLKKNNYKYDSTIERKTI